MSTAAVTEADSSVKTHVLREQVRLVYRQSKTGISGNIVVAVVCLLVGRFSGLPWVSLLPLFVVLAAYGLRLLLLIQFLHDEGRRTVPAWWRMAIFGSLGAGVAWGLTCLSMFPMAPEALKVFLVIIGAGLTSAGVATLAPVRAVYLGYLVPFIAPLSVTVALYFPWFPRAMSGLLLFYLVVMIRTSKEQSDSIANSLRLSFENQALVSALVAAKERADEARAHAEAANQAKSQFLARMSHEIRTPLNGIIGVHELLLTSTLGPEERRFVETAHQSGRALMSIINDVLDFSKIEAGKVALEEAPFKLERLLEELMALFAIATHRKGLLLSYELDEAVPLEVRGDEVRLRQVLTNLLGNAIKFTSKGAVTLVVRADGAGLVRFGVKDSGPGIDAKDRARIFESFEQADGSITRRFGGTGLGLAISRHLVELMGGTLDIESEPGRGSEFFFTARLPEAPGGEPWPRPGDGRRALVMIREERSSATVARWLTAAGFRVEASAGPAEFEGVGLVVIAEELVEALEAARRAGVPAVACEQALSLDLDRQEGDEARARIALPLQRSALLAAVGQLLRTTERASARGEQRRTWTNTRVLVVDDDAVNRTVARAMLGRLGCQPLVVSGGQEALEALSRERVDLVLMDCEMPDIDGLTVTKEVRRREREQARPRVAVVALTGHATEVQRGLCLAAEMDEMLTKPLSLAALTACLERWTPRPGD
jgi:signal transduction histidine kinase/ActR/RegA family two-component response regulator